MLWISFTSSVSLSLASSSESLELELSSSKDQKHHWSLSSSKAEKLSFPLLEVPIHLPQLLVAGWPRPHVDFVHQISHFTLANCPPLKLSTQFHGTFHYPTPPQRWPQTTCPRVGCLEYQNRWQEHSPDKPHEEGSPLCLQKLRTRGWPPTQHWRFTTVCILTCIPSFVLLAGPAVGKKVILLASFRKDKLSCRKALWSVIIKGGPIARSSLGTLSAISQAILVGMPSFFHRVFIGTSSFYANTVLWHFWQEWCGLGLWKVSRSTLSTNKLVTSWHFLFSSYGYGNPAKKIVR